jgi:hypothetical protein
MIQVGPWLFAHNTDEQLIQIKGPHAATTPTWSPNQVGTLAEIPGPPPSTGGWLQNILPKKVDPNAPIDWQSIIAEVLSHDCDFPKECVLSSMADATEGHRYGALRDFITTLPSQINRDFVGLTSSDGVGGSDSNKEPDNPVIATIHPITGETWGIYLYLAVPFGGEPWGWPSNPVSLLLKFKKVADCGDWLTPENVATVAGLTILTGGTYGLLTGLGIISLCYIWQFIKVVVAVVVDVVEAVVGAVSAVACALSSVQSLDKAVTQTGVQTKNAAATAVGVGLTVANALCGNGTCPPGMVQTPAGCACAQGYVPGVVNGVQGCIVSPPWYQSPIALIAIAVVGVLGYSILKEPKTARSAA